MDAHGYSPWNGSYPSTMEEVKDGESFVIGDIVALVTGSPDFVVVDVCECGSVHVAWYDDNGMNDSYLPEEALVHA